MISNVSKVDKNSIVLVTYGSADENDEMMQ